MFRRHGVDVARATVARARQAPKTSSGKIARRRCREALEAGALDVVYATEKVAGAEKTCARGLSSAERKKLANALADASEADVLARCRRLVGAVLRVAGAAVDDDAPVNALGRGGRVSEVATMPPRRRRRRVSETVRAVAGSAPWRACTSSRSSSARLASRSAR